MFTVIFFNLASPFGFLWDHLLLPFWGILLILQLCQTSYFFNAALRSGADLPYSTGYQHPYAALPPLPAGSIHPLALFARRPVTTTASASSTQAGRMAALKMLESRPNFLQLPDGVPVSAGQVGSSFYGKSPTTRQQRHSGVPFVLSCTRRSLWSTVFYKNYRTRCRC